MGQTAVVIPEKIYFKIGEVCELVGVQAHVLRYWETEFPMLSPQKNRSGQRSYRRRDVEIALRIKELLYDDMYTIAGAKKKLQGEIRETPKLKVVSNDHIEQPAVSPRSEPGLFDADLELDDDADADMNTSAEFDGNRPMLSSEKAEAIRSLTAQLLELREMLKTDQTAEAAEHLRDR
jgi:DNA-binding transcriptional MerR regulator